MHGCFYVFTWKKARKAFLKHAFTSHWFRYIECENEALFVIREFRMNARKKSACPQSAYLNLHENWIFSSRSFYAQINIRSRDEKEVLFKVFCKMKECALYRLINRRIWQFSLFNNIDFLYLYILGAFSIMLKWIEGVLFFRLHTIFKANKTKYNLRKTNLDQCLVERF